MLLLRGLQSTLSLEYRSKEDGPSHHLILYKEIFTPLEKNFSQMSNATCGMVVLGPHQYHSAPVSITLKTVLS